MTKEKNKNSWLEWLQLGVTFSIPVAIAVYTILQDNRQLAIASKNREQDLAIADDQQKDMILHECQQTLSKLMEKYGTNLNETTSAPFVARFATLSAINQLDSARRSFLLYLLYEARLINYRPPNYNAIISLETANLSDIDLVVNLHSKLLKYVSFDGVIMERANFRTLTIYGLTFQRAILRDSDFSSTSNGWVCDSAECIMNKRYRLNFDYSDLQLASFVHAVYDTVTFDEALMDKIKLESFTCLNCSFLSSSIKNANLTLSIFENSTFTYTKLSNTNLQESTIGPNVVIEFADMKFINATKIKLIQSYLINNDVEKGVFEYATIKNTTFQQTRMKHVSIGYSTITYANFIDVNFYESNWLYVRCEKCFFSNVNFTLANMRHAVFVDSVFENSYLDEKQLADATFIKN